MDTFLIWSYNVINKQTSAEINCIAVQAEQGIPFPSHQILQNMYNVYSEGHDQMQSSTA